MDAPEKITGDSIALLDGLVKEFPYCQTAQLLLAKGLNNDNSIRYGSQLKIAAAYAADRKVLYQLIMRKPQEAVVTEEKQEAAGTLVIPDNDNELLNNLVISAQENTQEETIEEKEEERPVEPVMEQPVITEPGVKEEIQETVQEEKTIAEEEKPVVEERTEKPSTEEPKTEEVAEIPVVPELPPLEQNIIVKAIDASIELEVSENMPFKENGESFEAERSETSETLKSETSGTEKTETSETERSETPETEKQETSETEEKESFDPGSTHSFTEWLKHAKKAKASEEKEQQEELKQEETAQPKKRTRKDIDDLIDKFISEEPKISRPSPKQDFFSPVNKARQSVQEDDEFVTETLANIYLKQGSYAKAIKTYETLSLKFPEKKLYFAARIKEIKKIIKEQK